MSQYPPLAQIAGNVVGDPEMKMAGDNEVLEFSLACTEQYGDPDAGGKTRFVRVSIWKEPLQQSVQREVYRGAKVVAEGNLKSREVGGRTFFDMMGFRVGLVQWLSTGKRQQSPSEDEDGGI